MGVVSAFALIALGLKSGLALIGTTGVIYGLNWFHKVSFKGKKGGGLHEGDFNSERFSRTDLQ